MDLLPEAPSDQLTWTVRVFKFATDASMVSVRVKVTPPNVTLAAPPAVIQLFAPPAGTVPAFA